jgi:predicted dehydrogenase
MPQHDEGRHERIDFVPAPRSMIAGAGLMGRWHADASVHAGGDVVAVCDLDLGAAEALARRSSAAAGTDFTRLLDDVAPDVVHVCTPLATHFQLAQEALKRCLHVIVEKPLARSLEETEALLTLARERGVVLCPVHQLSFQHWLPRVPAVGEILDLCYSTCSAGADGRSDSERDRVAAEIVPHPLSLFERILPGSLDQARWVVRKLPRGELRAFATAGNASLALFISMAGRPPQHELRVVGGDGTLIADLFHGFAWLEKGGVSRAHKLRRPFANAALQMGAASRNLVRRAWMREFAYPGLRELVAAAYGEIGGGEARALSPDHIRRVARAREEILSSTG